MQRSASPGGNDVLGEIAGGIGGRPVDLGRILARKGAAAVRRRAAIGIDDDLAAGQSAVAVRTADIELTRRIDVPDRILGHPPFGQGLIHIGRDDLPDLRGGQVLGRMLMRNDDLGRSDRLAVLVAHGDLALRIGTEVAFGSAMTRLGNEAENLVRIENRRRHEFRRLPAGVAEHDALITRSLVLVSGGIDTLGNVGRLRVQQDFDLGAFPMKALLLVADGPNGLAHRMDDRIVGESRAADFAGDDHPIGGRQSLAGHPNSIRVDPAPCALAEVEIDDFVGNAIANLVRMAFGNGFAREEVVLADHCILQLRPIEPARDCRRERLPPRHGTEQCRKRRCLDRRRSFRQAFGAIVFFKANALIAPRR